MKKILVVSACTMRGDTTGLVGKFLNSIKNLDELQYEVSLFDIGFFEGRHDSQKYLVANYYSLPFRVIEPIIRRIPKIRSHYAEHIIVSTFGKILKENHFDAVLLHHIPAFSDRLVNATRKVGVKTIFYPGGSDILRVNERTRKRLMNAFLLVDYVVAAIGSNTAIAAKDIYHVPENKLRLKPTYLKGVEFLMGVNKNLSKEEMMEITGIGKADYNIVCSYNGYPEHRHKVIIEALLRNREVLPKNYQIVFPMTYGASENYIEELKKMCADADLNVSFLTSFITNEQMAYLHLVTDLFIEIQPTDAGNAFMIEALFAQNQIVTGSWLNYKQFEQFGVPYYLIDKVEELPEMLKKILTGQAQRPVVSPKLIDMFTVPQNYSSVFFWENLFQEL